MIKHNSQRALRIRVAPIRSHAIELHRLFLVQLDAVSALVQVPEMRHRVHVSERHTALENFRGLLRGFYYQTSLRVNLAQRVDRFRNLALHVAAELSQIPRFARRRLCSTDGT